MISLIRRAVGLVTLIAAAGPSLVTAQGIGTVRGTVTRSDDGAPLVGVTVTVKGVGGGASTGPSGRYVLERVPAGSQTLVFRWLGYRPVEVAVTVTAGGTATADAKMEPAPIALNDLVVESASKVPERAVEAPAAISVVDPQVLQSTSVTGQLPLALATVPGVDIAQNGVNDFNVNARGFNSSLNRRVLVLVDGRDVSTGFLGNQEWNALPVPMEDISSLEFVRGPGSALYGANAYSGVINITTPSAREVVGTKFSMGGGQLSTFKADLRHAGLWAEGRVGYRVNLGYYRSDSWTRSRTTTGAFADEYRVATDSAFRAICSACARRELRALNGQTADLATGALSGDPDPVKNIYGSARLDYYADNGEVITGEFGIAQAENEVAVTGIGRVQISQTARPFGRLNWAGKNFDVMGYWSGRDTKKPQYSLASTAGLEETSNILHLEGQQNNSFDDGRGRFVLGGSIRNIQVDTKRTLMGAARDDRSDYYYALFSQFEYKVSDKVKAVVAARYDVGSLIKGQFSPKAALVVTPNDRHSVRFTYNRAFQTPNYSEFFLDVAAGAPANLSALEAGLRANASLAPILATVPAGTLFTNSAAVAVRARGNGSLQVETNQGFEVGYRGDLTNRFYFSADVYLNSLSNFVTDLLPGVNPSFGQWTAPATAATALPAANQAAARAALAAAVRGALLGSPATRTAGLGLTRLEDGATAIVLSYTNAGKAIQYGVEFGAGLQLSNEFRADGSFTLFRFDIKEQQQGDQLLPNTPRAKGNLSVSYAGRSGFDAGVTFRATKGYDWAAGVYAGFIEPASSFDANVGYAVNNNLRVYLTGHNIFDQERFSIFGGSVNGRRILGGLTTRF
ncbi:MAG: TonB-dependent receptor [Gemmatimonadetes bacterium]|nr:TonB-dependent receptor [Gemmatimonadota bacterium]